MATSSRTSKGKSVKKSVEDITHLSIIHQPVVDLESFASSSLPHIKSIIEKSGLDKFLLNPVRYNEQLVRDFYSSATVDGDSIYVTLKEKKLVINSKVVGEATKLSSEGITTTTIKWNFVSKLKKYLWRRLTSKTGLSADDYQGYLDDQEKEDKPIWEKEFKKTTFDPTDYVLSGILSQVFLNRSGNDSCVSWDTAYLIDRMVLMHEDKQRELANSPSGVPPGASKRDQENIEAHRLLLQEFGEVPKKFNWADMLMEILKKAVKKRYNLIQCRAISAIVNHLLPEESRYELNCGSPVIDFDLLAKAERKSKKKAEGSSSGTERVKRAKTAQADPEAEQEEEREAEGEKGAGEKAEKEADEAEAETNREADPEAEPEADAALEADPKPLSPRVEISSSSSSPKDRTKRSRSGSVESHSSPPQKKQKKDKQKASQSTEKYKGLIYFDDEPTMVEYDSTEMFYTRESAIYYNTLETIYAIRKNGNEVSLKQRRKMVNKERRNAEADMAKNFKLDIETVKAFKAPATEEGKQYLWLEEFMADSIELGIEKEAKLAEVQKELEELKQRRASYSLDSENTKLKADLAQLKDDRWKLTIEKQEAEESKKKAEEKAEKLEADVALLKKQIAESRTQAESQLVLLGSPQSENRKKIIEDLQRQLSERITQKSEMEIQLAARRVEIKEMEKILKKYQRLATFDKTVNTVYKRADGQATVNGMLRAELDSAVEKLEAAKVDLEEARKQVEDWHVKADTLEIELATARSLQGNPEAEAALKAEIAQLRNKVQEQEVDETAESLKAEEARKQKEKEIEGLKAELERMKAEVEKEKALVQADDQADKIKQMEEEVKRFKAEAAKAEAAKAEAEAATAKADAAKAEAEADLAKAKAEVDEKQKEFEAERGKYVSQIQEISDKLKFARIQADTAKDIQLEDQSKIDKLEAEKEELSEQLAIALAKADSLQTLAEENEKLKAEVLTRRADVQKLMDQFDKQQEFVLEIRKKMEPAQARPEDAQMLQVLQNLSTERKFEYLFNQHFEQARVNLGTQIQISRLSRLLYEWNPQQFPLTSQVSSSSQPPVHIEAAAQADQPQAEVPPQAEPQAEPAPQAEEVPAAVQADPQPSRSVPSQEVD